MLWEITGTRNSQPIRARVSASSEASARHKAEANGVTVLGVVAIDDSPESGAAPVASAASEPPRSNVQKFAPAPLNVQGGVLPGYQPAANAAQRPFPAQQWPAAPSYAQPLPYVSASTTSDDSISGLAIASLVCGCVATCLFCIWFISVPTAITGLTLGIIAWVTAHGRNNRRDRNFAMAGTFVSIAPFVLMVTIFAGLLSIFRSATKAASSAAARASAVAAASKSSSGSSTAAPSQVSPPPAPTPADLTAKLQTIQNTWRSGSSIPDDLTPTMQNRLAVPQDDGSILIYRSGDIASLSSFRPPIRFRIVALSDEQDMRISYGARQIIFNWQMDRDMLRIDGGPASGTHKAGAGRLANGQWVGIDLTVFPDEMFIYVDGTERYHARADFSRINEPLRIRAHTGEVRINSVVSDKP